MMKHTTLIHIVMWCIACSPQSPQPEVTGQEEQEERQMEAYGGESQRVSTRILYFSETDPPSSPGAIAINYGQPQWKSEYEEKFDELTKGKRWRFGNNFWTSLDTNVAMTMAGTEIGPGQYYLALERSPEDQWYLLLFDPVPIRAKKLDAFFIDEAPGGMEVPLEWKRKEESADRLMVKLIPDEGDLKKASLEIQWGKHMLMAPIEVVF
jgi:hypothetical protein